MTAYEMRISDWSSDVCSSDLLAIARDPIFIDSMCELANNVDEARHHAASNIAQLLASTPSAASAATLDASFRAISLSIRTSAKIGRASCRERVCQSG